MSTTKIYNNSRRLIALPAFDANPDTHTFDVPPITLAIGENEVPTDYLARAVKARDVQVMIALGEIAKKKIALRAKPLPRFRSTSEGNKTTRTGAIFSEEPADSAIAKSKSIEDIVEVRDALVAETRPAVKKALRERFDQLVDAAFRESGFFVETKPEGAKSK